MIRKLLEEHMTFKIIHESFVRSMQEFFDISIEEIKEMEAIKFAKQIGIPQKWLHELGIDISNVDGISTVTYLSNLKHTHEEVNKLWHLIIANEITIVE